MDIRGFGNFESVTLHRKQKNINAKRDSGGLIVFIRDTIFDSEMVIKRDNDDII